MKDTERSRVINVMEELAEEEKRQHKKLIKQQLKECDTFYTSWSLLNLVKPRTLLLFCSRCDASQFLRHSRFSLMKQLKIGVNPTCYTGEEMVNMEIGNIWVKRKGGLRAF